MFKNIIAAVTLLLAIKSVFAQKIDTVGVNNLKEVVITGQYAPQSEKNAVYKVKVIDTEVIQQKAANNLRELLQQELNINLSQNSVFGTSIDIQGISKENIKYASSSPVNPAPIDKIARMIKVGPSGK